MNYFYENNYFSGGRFHAFNLAEEIDKKGYLLQLITSYPKFYIKKILKLILKD